MNNEALLAPIAGGLPCGADLSFSTEFDQIAEMRREDDPTLDQGEWVTALKVADWPGVVRQCTHLLSQQTKDLRLAQWLTEALALTQGYAGLLQGLQLCTALCENHWDDLHPQADDGDMDQRVGNMTWLLQRLVSLANTRPLTRGRQGAVYSLQDMAIAHQWQAQQERSPQDARAQASDRVTLEQFMRALRETPKDELRATLQTVQACEQQLRAWQTVVDAKLGHQGPSFVSAKEALSGAVHDVERLAREVGALAAAPDEQPAGTHDAESKADGGTADDLSRQGTAKGPLRSRAQALQQLRDVAAFFRRTEPHSPVAYLAEKAVKWGDMPLHEWLRKVVKDQGSMSHLHELLGVEPEEGEANL
ncbi:MAG: type VI secretion system protein TssA [Aquabacterium sp.]|uniref:type VI secretion system protein TssA n=1 Tax=Aquabacterium sp. TaxID=1872578 RepID=UPI0027174A4A|nr:type VI secretion system protein TssA [Aquabacterium sp.]MDO9001915.1 type VI secretion system protein TssA [Aquabacterium sp.]